MVRGRKESELPLLLYSQFSKKYRCARTVIKGLQFSRPQPGCHLPNSLWLGIIKLIPARKSLVNDIPAGDGRTANLFYSAVARREANREPPLHQAGVLTT